MYTEVSVEPTDALVLTVTGEGADLPADEQHLAVQVVRSVLGHDRVAITLTSETPVSRGLGSSAALAVAAATAAGLHDTVELRRFRSVGEKPSSRVGFAPGRRSGARNAARDQ